MSITGTGLTCIFPRDAITSENTLTAISLNSSLNGSNSLIALAGCASYASPIVHARADTSALNSL